MQRLSATVWIERAEDITEEWLVTAGMESGYTEHIRHFKKVLNKMHVRDFLEFGLGFSTKYFIDHCEKVISVEIITPGSGPEWFAYCIDLFRDCKTWTPIAYVSGDCPEIGYGFGVPSSCVPYIYSGDFSVYKAASYQPVHRKSYALIDPSYLADLNRFVDGLVAKNNIDLAFVDAGVCIRGDLVQVLFNKVPIIVAHDIRCKKTRHIDDVYGYDRVQIPANYVEIHVPFGMGTAFWVKMEEPYLNIIRELLEYVATEG